MLNKKDTKSYNSGLDTYKKLRVNLNICGNIYSSKSSININKDNKITKNNGGNNKKLKRQAIMFIDNPATPKHCLLNFY